VSCCVSVDYVVYVVYTCHLFAFRLVVVICVIYVYDRGNTFMFKSR
jgi:hypothetical protein